MEYNNQGKGDVIYNQAALQQQRINNLYAHIDFLSINMFAINPELTTRKKITRNYEIIINDLNSLFLIICSKLTPDEAEKIKGMRIKVRNLVRTSPPFIYSRATGYGRPEIKVNESYANQDLIADEIQEYRILIEEGMESHGFSNPSKQDITKSVVKM